MPDSSIPFQKAHRTKVPYKASVYRDFKSICPHLVPGSVLDIGCGLGALSVLLHRHCGGRLYLLDETGWASRRKGNTNGAFNDMDLTEEVMRLNGVTDYELLGFDDPLPEVDNVVSTYSWGWHYPLKTYRPKAKVIIADIRPSPLGTPIKKLEKGFRCIINRDMEPTNPINGTVTAVIGLSGK